MCYANHLHNHQEKTQGMLIKITSCASSDIIARNFCQENNFTNFELFICEILHHVKIFCYTVCVRESQNSWNALANDVMALN